VIQFIVFFFGAAIGSFINCLVYRLHLADSSTSDKDTSKVKESKMFLRAFLFGRSFCPKCSHHRAWSDNIPLLSFILMRGKCRYCGEKIFIHYPLMELATGIMTVLVFHLSYYPTVQGVLTGHLGGGIYLILISYALMAIFLSDILYFTIPDEIVWPAIGLAVFANFFALPILSASRCLQISPRR